eukprot:scaffold5055_cov210-Alexandrium_tamarense.AAC.2
MATKSKEALLQLISCAIDCTNQCPHQRTNACNPSLAVDPKRSSQTTCQMSTTNDASQRSIVGTDNNSSYIIEMHAAGKLRQQCPSIVSNRRHLYQCQDSTVDMHRPMDTDRSMTRDDTPHHLRSLRTRLPCYIFSHLVFNQAFCSQEAGVGCWCCVE